MLSTPLLLLLLLLFNLLADVDGFCAPICCL
jgi:hypothetical protein